MSPGLYCRNNFLDQAVETKYCVSQKNEDGNSIRKDGDETVKHVNVDIFRGKLDFFEKVWVHREDIVSERLKW